MNDDQEGIKAVYAGSFDPPTNGHLWMIEQAAKMFGHVVVAVAVNPEKKPTFSVEDRVKMLTSMTTHMGNVEVLSFPYEFSVRCAKSIGATISIRGLRNATDLQYELDMQRANEDLEPGITTMFLVPPRDLAYVSSSFAKGILGPKGGEIAVARYVPPVVLRQMIGLKHKVWEHLEELGAIGDKYEFWDSVLTSYMKPDRHYHNWYHIVEMLNLFDKVRNLAINPTAVEVGILLHDRVYNPFRSDNEAASCPVMRQMCKHVGLSKMFGDTVEGLIMVTKHSDEFPCTYCDEMLLVDLDLAILGASPERFDEYEAGIRAEYAHVVSDEDFAKGRSAILQGFLDRSRIFHTNYFHEKFGTQAEGNLKRSIGKLSLSTQ